MENIEKNPSYNRWVQKGASASALSLVFNATQPILSKKNKSRVRVELERDFKDN
jgi:hypothetical protein